MNSKILHGCFLLCLLVLLNACSDAENENNLVNLHTTANQDIISINFPADTETILSISSQYAFVLQGTQSNNIDTINIIDDVQWSLSDGANSRIDQNGLFTASATAELITLTARFGIFTESIDIQVSDAKFDRVIQLNDGGAIIIDMCQSQTFKPVGLYIDGNNNDEIRPVDSIIINTIEWIVLDQATNTPSQRAYIETLNNQATLQALADGDLIIQAKAFSEFAGIDVTSIDFSQQITANINLLKLCNNTDTDLATCNVSSAKVEKDKVLSLISVANYDAQDGSNFNENISANSKWGIDNSANATIAFSANRQQLDITGIIEETSVVVSVACGDIEQPIDSIDITQGVVLDSEVSCNTTSNCQFASASIGIDQLTVSALNVSANGTDLTSTETLILDTRPDEITLITTAVYSNSSEKDITSDSELVYSITAGNNDVIEEISGSLGVYTVLGNGTAEIKLDYRGETFFAVISIP
ncbi:MAG: hypothetical protein ACN4GM_09020 [Gammaproteobacteria bacterium]